MATCRDIITGALRMVGVISIGRDPRASEASDAMIALQSLYDGWFFSGMFGRLNDIYASTNMTALEGQRITAENAQILIPSKFEGRAPYDLSAITVITEQGQFNFVHSGGKWETCSGLELGSYAPLSSRGQRGLSSVLAASLCEDYGAIIGPMQMREAAGFRTSLSLRQGSTNPPYVVSYF
jgi:hypothetical protein